MPGSLLPTAVTRPTAPMRAIRRPQQPATDAEGWGEANQGGRAPRGASQELWQARQPGVNHRRRCRRGWGWRKGVQVRRLLFGFRF